MKSVHALASVAQIGLICSFWLRKQVDKVHPDGLTRNIYLKIDL